MGEMFCSPDTSGILFDLSTVGFSVVDQMADYLKFEQMVFQMHA